MPVHGRPKSVSARDGRILTAAFDNGERYRAGGGIPACQKPGAPRCRGHSPDERKTVPGKRDVMIIEIKPIGNYAVRLTFDDMHSTGIYSWDYFAELGRKHAQYWQDYLDELAAKGLSRDPVHKPR